MLVPTGVESEVVDAYESVFREELATAYDIIASDLLLIDYVVLNPRWRKLKLGLLAVRKLVDLLGGGVGLAVSEIAPLRADAHKQLRVPADWLNRSSRRAEACCPGEAFSNSKSRPWST